MMWPFFSLDSSKYFPYEIGETVLGLEDESVWSLHKAKKKGSGEEVSVFVFDIKNGSGTQFDVAKTAVKRLKTLRHPNILTYLDSLESEKVLYLVTEYVEPLETLVTQLSKEGHHRELYLAWGIFQITRALSFLNNDCNLQHNNVCISSVFANAAGDWKLGGLEYVAGASEGMGLPIKILPALEKYDPPEKSDPSKQRHVTKCSTDMWGLGCLVWESFNGPLPQQPALKDLENIPKQLSAVYCELVGANPSSRPNPADVITRCRKLEGYFKNDLVDALLFLEEIQIKDDGEKDRFLGAITPQLDNFPENICRHKILPQLITALEYRNAGSAILMPMFKLGCLLDGADYQKKMVPWIVKLFASRDCATRKQLLQQLDHFIGHLQAATVNDQIFPQIANDFMDANPTIRELAVESVIHLAPKLNFHNLNEEVLQHFLRMQVNDNQVGVRTKIIECITKIVQHIDPVTRYSTLIREFTYSMQHPFPRVRIAGLQLLVATKQYIPLRLIVNLILVALLRRSDDPEKSVREHIFRTIKFFLGMLEEVSEDPSLRESMKLDVPTVMRFATAAATYWSCCTAANALLYRSQSDTVNLIKPAASKTLSKPDSLEQSSSSSISTMTSLEQEESKRAESVSDYDETWDIKNLRKMNLDEADYQKKVVPCIVKLFASRDSATWIRLLQQLDHYIEHLQAATVNNEIFPHIAYGFMDANPIIRELTVELVIHLAPKLNYKNLNVEVFQNFKRMMQDKDNQVSIRAKIIVCTIKIARNIDPQDFIIRIFIHAMNDPFPPIRSAGLQMLAATQQYFVVPEVLMCILPRLFEYIPDPEKSVRDNIFRTIILFLGKLEEVSEDPNLRESMKFGVERKLHPMLFQTAVTWRRWAVMLKKQSSNSSISTTRREQEESKGAEAVSDYVETWDTNNWGEMNRWDTFKRECLEESGGGQLCGKAFLHCDSLRPRGDWKGCPKSETGNCRMRRKLEQRMVPFP